ncbi:MAG: endonuclease domain-containing protein [Nitrosomonadales bacterium]|nr:endonuclease domain-containing protein [Nitrosomonadales bacterium]
MPHYPAKLPEDIRAYAREMRSKMTDAEALLWKLLRNRRIADAKFRRQHPVGRYILDFYCDEKRLGVELDGGQHGEATGYDEIRDAWLQSQGIKVLRFWNNQMLAETEAVMEAIYQAVVEFESKATKAPLPQAGDNQRLG